MTEVGSATSLPARSLPEVLARALRHEVGDFLQKVYATAAILKTRLPADWDMEQALIARLRTRAQDCRVVLDNVHDLVCPLSLACETVDLTQTAEQVLTAQRLGFPQLQLQAVAAGAAVIIADPRRVQQVDELLLANACQAARSRVCFETRVELAATEVHWCISDDGPGIAPELQERLFSPFFTTNPGHCGVGLALARKLVELHGGRIKAGNLPEGGFAVYLAWPLRATEP